MPSNKDKASSRAQPRRSRVEEEAEEARLDALIAAPPKALSRPVKSVLASKLDKPRTEQKSVMQSKLDKARQEQKSTMLSRLDKTATEKSKMASRLDRSQMEKWKVASRLEQVEIDEMISKLDKTSLQTKHPELVEGQVKTTYTKPHDIEMASRQTKYDTLSPAEQKKQEEWAQQKIRDIGMCPAGFGWMRVPGGYNCEPGSHWMSDELIAEGKGGWYYRRATMAERQEWYETFSEHCFGMHHRHLLSGRAIGFSKGLDRFHGPHYIGVRRSLLVPVNPNQPRRPQFSGLMDPARQSLDPYLAIPGLLNRYSNNGGPFDNQRSFRNQDPFGSQRSFRNQGPVGNQGRFGNPGRRPF